MSSAFSQYTLDDIDRREAYRLLTSVVVPRPIAWVSSVSEAGVPNLAPFSYFTALAAEPVLIGVSIGARSNGEPKDSLRNIRETGVFCVNVVTEDQLTRMNETAAALPPEESEFERVGLDLDWTEDGRTPFVADCPVVLECTLHREIDLSPASNTFVIGQVVGARIRRDLLSGDALVVDPEALRPVGRLGGNLYALPGPIGEAPRP